MKGFGHILVDVWGLQTFFEERAHPRFEISSTSSILPIWAAIMQPLYALFCLPQSHRVIQAAPC